MRIRREAFKLYVGDKSYDIDHDLTLPARLVELLGLLSPGPTLEECQLLLEVGEGRWSIGLMDYIRAFNAIGPSGASVRAAALEAYRRIGDDVRRRFRSGDSTEEAEEIRRFMRGHVPALLGVAPDPDI